MQWGTESPLIYSATYGGNYVEQTDLWLYTRAASLHINTTHYVSTRLYVSCFNYTITKRKGYNLDK